MRGSGETDLKGRHELALQAVKQGSRNSHRGCAALGEMSEPASPRWRPP